MGTGNIELKIDGIDEEQVLRAQEILIALVASGGLWGVKGGKTILHFDADGLFQGVELQYWPWRRRSEPKNIAYGRRKDDKVI